MFSSAYFSLAVLFVAALGFGLGALDGPPLGNILFASKIKPDQDAVYECGRCRGRRMGAFRPAYYYMPLFLVFDIESVFLLPFAVAFTGLGVAACVSMLVFVLLLVEGLAWAWARGVLTWN